MKKLDDDSKEHYDKIIAFLDKARMNPYGVSYLLGKSCRVKLDDHLKSLKGTITYHVKVLFQVK
jgi:hypothetical protein